MLVATCRERTVRSRGRSGFASRRQVQIVVTKCDWPQIKWQLQKGTIIAGDEPKRQANLVKHGIIFADVGEGFFLSWEWVQEPRLMLPDSKTGAKVVYLNRQAIDVIASLRDRKPTGLLFPSVRNPDKPITLGIHWSKIRNRAALPDVRLHEANLAMTPSVLLRSSSHK